MYCAVCGAAALKNPFLLRSIKFCCQQLWLHFMFLNNLGIYFGWPSIFPVSLFPETNPTYVRVYLCVCISHRLFSELLAEPAGVSAASSRCECCAGRRHCRTNLPAPAGCCRRFVRKLPGWVPVPSHVVPRCLLNGVPHCAGVWAAGLPHLWSSSDVGRKRVCGGDQLPVEWIRFEPICGSSLLYNDRRHSGT